MLLIVDIVLVVRPALLAYFPADFRPQAAMSLLGICEYLDHSMGSCLILYRSWRHW